MHSGGVRHYFAHLHKDAAPELVDAFTERGLRRYHRAWIKLARDRSPLHSAPPSVCDGDMRLCAAQRAHADAFAQLVVRCHQTDPTIAALLAGVVQRPRWHVYLVELRGEPIAAGALFVQGDVGYLGYDATLPEHRGQGLQRMLLAKRIRVALALGCRVIASETGQAVPGQSNSSYNNMIGLGLAPIATRDNYALDGVRYS
jgi:GNAT superfamily N-acetyltransferase